MDEVSYGDGWDDATAGKSAQSDDGWYLVGYRDALATRPEDR